MARKLRPKVRKKVYLLTPGFSTIRELRRFIESWLECEDEKLQVGFKPTLFRQVPMLRLYRPGGPGVIIDRLKPSWNGGEPMKIWLTDRAVPPLPVAFETEDGQYVAVANCTVMYY